MNACDDCKDISLVVPPPSPPATASLPPSPSSSSLESSVADMAAATSSAEATFRDAEQTEEASLAVETGDLMVVPSDPAAAVNAMKGTGAPAEDELAGGVDKEGAAEGRRDETGPPACQSLRSVCIAS